MNFRSQYSREQKTEEMTLMLEFLTNDGCITALYEFIELYRYVTAGWTTADIVTLLFSQVSFTN